MYTCSACAYFIDTNRRHFLGLLIGVAVADVDNSLSEKGTYVHHQRKTYVHYNTNIFNVTIMVISKQKNCMRIHTNYTRTLFTHWVCSVSDLMRDT